MSDYVKSIRVDELLAEPDANGVISDYKDHTDPKYSGPGTWNVIHRLAYKAQTIELQNKFIEEMKEICYGFPCNLCRGHCTEYIKNHPLEEYLGILIEIHGENMMLGMFVWAWKFHNAVNKRINKPIMNWDTAFNLYSQTESLICSKQCTEAEDHLPDGLEHENPIPKITISTPRPLKIMSKR